MPTGPQSFRNTSRIAGWRECFLSVGLPNTAWNLVHSGSNPKDKHHLRQHSHPHQPVSQAPQESRAGISPEAEGRAPEIPIPAPMVAPQPVVKVVDQPEVPSGIEPTEVRVPTPQDGDEPRSLVQDSPLPSDECSDLNTQREDASWLPALKQASTFTPE